jgi:hypothetical protein
MNPAGSQVIRAVKLSLVIKNYYSNSHYACIANESNRENFLALVVF